MNKIRLLLLLLLSILSFFVNENAFAQKDKKKKNKASALQESTTDTLKAKKETPKKDISKIKPYTEIITEKAVTDSGLFIVHKINSTWYWEIPTELLEKEILIVTRLASTVENLDNFGGAGVTVRPEQVIRFQRFGEQLLMRSVSYSAVADSALPIHKAVTRNNFEPIIMNFDIKALSKDSQNVVIEINPLFLTDVEMIAPLSATQRKNFQIRRLDEKRSFITSLKSFPKNIEVRHILTYDAGQLPSNTLTNTLSLEVNQSFVMLPELPMRPRLYDERVGYFSVSQYNYGLEEQKSARQTFITRWRLEPKDTAAFKRGELTEPIKPIIYYIDPATPEKWRPYLKKGVEDWNVAFEAAGFKNAIICKYPPSIEEDPDFSPEDVRYSVIRYVTNPVMNAVGPHVHDPRTGEIIESDIIWYHNVMNLLRNWLFVQTAAINPDARKPKFDDKLMGECIRFVAAHEVGHTLGLPHNMAASSAYPVDSLRSAHFTQKMGTSPSIMDYARFNYVAQPQDTGVSLFPNIGMYDIYAIAWGYRPILEANSAEEERKITHAWVLAKGDSAIYRFGKQMLSPLDPSSQTEDLGDDAVKAGNYGIENLKRIVPNLPTWTKEEARGYEDLEELYTNVVSQWNRYINHAITSVGGVYEYYKTSDQSGAVYVPQTKVKQKEAVKFLHKQIYETPLWLIDTAILTRIEPNGIVNRIGEIQYKSLKNLLDFSRLARLVEHEALYGKTNSYTLSELFDDVRAGIWKEALTGKTPDVYRRNLQRAYIEQINTLFTKEQTPLPQELLRWTAFTAVNSRHSDIVAMARAELATLKIITKNASATATDKLTKYHYEELNYRIEDILSPKK